MITDDFKNQLGEFAEKHRFFEFQKNKFLVGFSIVGGSLHVLYRIMGDNVNFPLHSEFVENYLFEDNEFGIMLKDLICKDTRQYIQALNNKVNKNGK